MGFRCELCDEFLPMFQFSHLCPTCYKIRTIIKCYSAGDILGKLEKDFSVELSKEELIIEQDKKFFKDEEKRIEGEFKKYVEKENLGEVAGVNKEIKEIKENDDDDQKDYDKPNTKSFKKNSKYKNLNK